MQKLWDGVIPLSRKKRGFAPDADAEEVTRRVNAALDEESSAGRRSIRLWRPVRYALVFGAIIVLLAGTAVASGQGILPTFNVLTESFFGDYSHYAETLVNTDKYSVSDGNYTMSVTSVLADGGEVDFTLEIKPHNEKARRFLTGEDIQAWKDLYGQEEEYFYQPIELRASWGYGGSGVAAFYDREQDALIVSVEMTIRVGPWNQISVRYEVMDEGIWLRFPVKSVPDITLKINADGQGMGSEDCAAGGPVTLKKLVLSPMTLKMTYTTLRDEIGDPVIYFLWKDGALDTYGQIGARRSASSGAEKGDNLLSYKKIWKFSRIQDISKMEAIIFENTAYPLDGGEPYPYDVGDIPRPFVVARGEKLGEGGNPSMPLFAICGGLGIPYEWDKEAGTVTAAFRGVTMTFTAGSDILYLEGAEIPESRMRTAAVLSDGELWIDADWALTNCWKLQTDSAFKNHWTEWEGSLEYYLIVP